MGPLIDPDELKGLLTSAAPPVVLDVRWRLDEPDGRAESARGHVPGAVYVDLEEELSRHGEPADGRHPLPAAADLQAAARRWGVGEGDAVVVYDDADSLAAARAWWLLARSGVSDVRVLDGGLRAWREAGGAIEAGEVVPAPGDVVLTDPDDEAIGIDEAAAWPSRGVLLDVRAAARYRGEVEPLDPVAGHIPGAVSLPIARLMDAGRFLPADRLREILGEAGDGPVAAYCGSGVTAAQAALAGAIAGIGIAVYPGSWSQWSNTPGRPVATG